MIRETGSPWATPSAFEGDRGAWHQVRTSERPVNKSSSTASLPSGEKSSGVEEPGSGDAERRQVTVMFADMVGSTALSAKLDPELLGGLIRRYQDAVAGSIGRYGGFVAKFMGDGVLAYFGFPRAFEDAAERAARAAIGILSEVGAIETPDGTRVQARIGIATGLVVVGESSAPACRRSGPSSAKLPTSPPGCRHWPGRTASSLAVRPKAVRRPFRTHPTPASTI